MCDEETEGEGCGSYVELPVLRVALIGLCFAAGRQETRKEEGRSGESGGKEMPGAPAARLYYSNVEQISVVDIAIRLSKYPIDRSLSPPGTLRAHPLSPFALSSRVLPPMAIPYSRLDFRPPILSLSLSLSLSPLLSFYNR